MASVQVRIRSRQRDLGSAVLVALDRRKIRLRREVVVPPLAVGDQAEVVLRDKKSGGAVVVPAVAGAVALTEATAVVDLVFVEAGPVDPRDERRSSVRVIPARDTKVEVFLEHVDPKDVPNGVRLVDIGFGGMCLDLPESVIMAEVCLQILLPGEPFPLSLPARLCHRRPIGRDRVRCGFEIAWTHATEAASQILLLMRWVTAYRALVSQKLRDAAVTAE